MSGRSLVTCVVTPCFEEDAATLARCIDSVRRQTRSCDHLLVFDGRRPPDMALGDVRVLELDTCHADGGATPRAIGALLAASEGYGSIAFLDADNWFAPDHVETCLDTAAARSPLPTDLVVALRFFHRPDGSKMPLAESHSEAHVDTSCFFMLPGSYHTIPRWAFVPPEHGAVCDRIVWLGLRDEGLEVARNTRPTVHFSCTYASIFEMIGETPPAGAKDFASPRVMEELALLDSPTAQLYGRGTGLEVGRLLVPVMRFAPGAALRAEVTRRWRAALRDAGMAGSAAWVGGGSFATAPLRLALEEIAPPAIDAARPETPRLLFHPPQADDLDALAHGRGPVAVVCDGPLDGAVLERLGTLAAPVTLLASAGGLSAGQVPDGIKLIDDLPPPTLACSADRWSRRFDAIGMAHATAMLERVFHDASLSLDDLVARSWLALATSAVADHHLDGPAHHLDLAKLGRWSDGQDAAAIAAAMLVLLRRLALVVTPCPDIAVRSAVLGIDVLLREDGRSSFEDWHAELPTLTRHAGPLARDRLVG